MQRRRCDGHGINGAANLGLCLNLIREELSDAEIAAAMARRKQIYEEMYPETKVGANNQHTTARRQNGEERNSRFTQATAEAIGKSERTVQRHVTRG